MDKNIVLKLMKEYSNKRRELTSINNDINELIEIRYNNNEDNFFMDIADELIIHLIWSLNTKIDINFVRDCVYLGLFYLDRDAEILTQKQEDYLDTLEPHRKDEDMEKLLDFILEGGKEYENN